MDLMGTLGGFLGRGGRDADDTATKDEIAAYLRTSPEALEAFEAAYRKSALTDDFDSDNLFDMNSRQASAIARTQEDLPAFDEEGLADVMAAIVSELLAQTSVLSVTDGVVSREGPWPLPEGHVPVGNDDLLRFPTSVRPQLTGELMRVDVGQVSGELLLSHYMRSQDPSLGERERKTHYNMFRQGLDILDLDRLTYAMLGTNPNSMGKWLPAVARAVAAHGFFHIPDTRVATVPMTLLQLSRLDYMSLTPATLGIVDGWAHEAFALDDGRDYFIKTGTYSSKYDFRNARVSGEREVRELGEYLLFIQSQACEMAGPLSRPSIYGMSTTNEWVVRQFIEDSEHNPTIYKGLSLHTEYRVFIDCDADEVIGISPYWEPSVMTKRFGHATDSDSPHNRHDYVIYKAHELLLMERYEQNRETVLAHVGEMLPDLDLTGQWSLDVMQNEDEFWVIDMATADTSALSECVPAGRLRKSEENWLPDPSSLWLPSSE